MDAGRLAGPASVGVALGGTLLATLASPTFDWTEHALSELGATTTGVGTDATVLLFNGGLVAGAVLGLAFAWYLARTAATSLDRATGLLFALTSGAMGGVGLFPLTESLHGPVAVAFFLGLTATMAASSAAAFAGGRTAAGLLDVAMAAGHVLGWAAWIRAGGPESIGIAIPELWGAMLLSGWVILAATRPAGNRS